MQKIVSKVSDRIEIEIEIGERHVAVVRDRASSASYRVDLGVYLNSRDLEVLEHAPLPCPQTDGLLVRVAGYRDDPADFQDRVFFMVKEKSDNPGSNLEVGEYYHVPSFGEAEAVETFHQAPDIHVVWIDDTSFYVDKLPEIEEKLGRVWARGVVDIASMTHIASLTPSAFVRFVENECEKYPQYHENFDDEARDAFFAQAGFEDEQDFRACGGEDDYYDYGEISRLIEAGEGHRLDGFDEDDVDAYRLHPMESVRRRAERDIMEVAISEASSIDRSVTEAARREEASASPAP